MEGIIIIMKSNAEGPLLGYSQSTKETWVMSHSAKFQKQINLLQLGISVVVFPPKLDLTWID